MHQPRFDDALALIKDTGYDGVALTLDHHHFDPFAPELSRRAEALAAQLSVLKLGCVIETGARFLLDPRRKHEPTLVSPEQEGRALRVEFLRRAIDIAQTCGAEAVSFWAGVPRADVSNEKAQQYLEEGLAQVVGYAEQRAVTAALEPEPGMLIETVDDYLRVREVAPGIKLALDTGHCIVTGEREPENAVRELRTELGTVAIEDMKRGRHEHLPFGEGDMNIKEVLAALHEINFTKLVCVELSRESHRAHTMVYDALNYLRRSEQELASERASPINSSDKQ